MLAVVNDLHAIGRLAAQGSAQLADDDLALVAMHVLSDQRRAAAVRARVAIGLQGVHALAQQLTFEVGAVAQHVVGFGRRPPSPAGQGVVLDGWGLAHWDRRVSARRVGGLEALRPGARIQASGGLQSREETKMESLAAGTLAGTGSFRCEECGYVVTLAASDTLPACPSCGATAFVRASLFGGGPERFARDMAPARSDDERGAWLQRVRDSVTAPGVYLAYEDGDEIVLTALTREWTRVGRSLAADVRFDDPTVSRRHALVVRDGAEVRVLDDRSLNGVFVNGERVDSRVLTDGDEVLVGRYRMAYLDVVKVVEPTV